VALAPDRNRLDHRYRHTGAFFRRHHRRLLDQLRIIREQAPQSRGAATVAAFVNGKGTASIETRGVIAMAVLEKERRVSSSAASLDETCPCCGRPMQAAGQEAALRA
jgi:hypothetical protein